MYVGMLWSQCMYCIVGILYYIHGMGFHACLRLEGIYWKGILIYCFVLSIPAQLITYYLTFYMQAHEIIVLSCLNFHFPRKDGQI